VYNTSDGAKIEFTKPIRIDQINLRGFKKSETLKLIDGNFSKDYLQVIDIPAKLQKLVRDAQDYLSFLRNRLGELEKTHDFLSFVSQAGLYQWKYANSPFFGLFRPPLMNFSYALLSALCRTQKSQRASLGLRLVEAYLEFFQKCVDRVKMLEP
jgi:hypothetical protein